MDNKYVLGGVALAILLLGVFLPVGKESRTIVERVGALNTPDLSVGAVRLMSGGSDTFIQSTSTVICSLQSPSSTSTLVSGGAQVTAATSSATSLLLSKSPAPFVVGSVAGGGAVFASSSVASGALKTLEVPGTTTVGAMVFAPNTYFVVSQTGGGVLNQQGSCKALWMVN